ncbi:AraC family transcriptional regulator N-terminal domain-containing protein [Halomonas sp. SpR1]
MMCVEAPAGDLQSVYKPLVCLVLQGAKRILVGNQQAVNGEVFESQRIGV